MVTRQKFPESWIAVVIDSGGTIVARSHQSERFIGQKASSRLVEATRQSLTGTQESRTLDGIPVVTSFTRSERSGWSVAVGIPKEELNQQLWHSLWNALGITALLLVAGFGAAWYIARRVSGSITELGKPALALGQGGEVRVPRLYFKEADELGQALTTASTMLQESTAAARAWQARLRAILESAMDAIVVVDDEGTVVLFNSAAVSLFGWPLEESLGRPLTQFIPERQLVLDPGDPAPICIQYLRTQDDNPVFGLKRSGEEFPIETAVSEIVEGERRIFTVILRDITARLRVQQALERSNTDLLQFAYVASHDLKGPLRSINGFARLLELSYAPQLDARGSDLIQRITKAASRLEQLTNDLLELARVDSHGPAFSPVPMQDVIEEVRQLLDGPIKASEASLSVGTLPTILGSQTQLVHVFLNFLTNALKYRSARPLTVHIAAERQVSSWVFKVTDNGIGIDSSDYERIFDVFSRLHNSQQYEGTGIGLALCRKIVERHGGKIWVESVLGAGSTFNVSLPASEDMPMLKDLSLP